MNKQRGFILVMALFIMALGSTLVTSLLQHAVTYDRLHKVLFRQQQARMLALNGIEIACAQLSNPVTLEKDQKPIDQNLVPFLYTDYVQTFTFTGEKEEIEGEITLFISSEEGKINPHQLFDVTDKKYTLTRDIDGQKIMALFNEYAQKQFGVENIESQVLSQLQKNTYEDITQIITPSFKGAVFKDISPLIPEQGALTDLFTVVTRTFTLQPLYLSDSLAQALKLEKQYLTKDKKLEIIKKLSKSSGSINWQQQWKELLAPLYKKEYTGIPDVLKKSIASKIETTAFLVISYGKIERGGRSPLTQKVSAYIEKTVQPDTKAITYTVKRLYWL